MNYILVKNQEQVFLGPFDWKPRYIQSEIDQLIEDGELSTFYQVPPVEQGYIDIGDGFEIIPITDSSIPAIDPLFEDPIGPFYTYANNNATVTYSKQDRPLHFIKSDLIQLAGSIRYNNEVAGTTANTSVGSISVSTDRDSRLQYSNLLSSMGSNTINFKTGTEFVTLTSNDMQIIVNTIHNHVQEQFDWELQTINELNTIDNIDDFKSILLNKLTPPTENTGLPNA